VLAFTSVWLVARHGGRLTSFERLALLVTLVSGLWAIRSIVWFALTALLVLPLAVDGAFAERARRPKLGRLRRAAGIAAALGVLAGAGAAAAQPPSWFLNSWPRSALPSIREQTRAPSTRVFANDRYADWLLWELPKLRGRIAYDVRFELFRERQFRELHAYRSEIGDNWRRAARGYELLTFDPEDDRTLVAAVSRSGGTRTVYTSRLITVLAQRSQSASSTVANPIGHSAPGTASRYPPKPARHTCCRD
jgi:hypothetical protein